MVKTCSRCKQDKDTSEFYAINDTRTSPPKKRLKSHCKACEVLRLKAYHKEHPRPGYWKEYMADPEHRDRYNKLTRQRKRDDRETVIAHYGGFCQCCGEDRFEFLAIDHVNGGGNQHRKQRDVRSNGLAAWLIRNNYPEGYQVLCHSCNMAKGSNGRCPHSTIISDLIGGLN